jgi:hypothetical protein
LIPCCEYQSKAKKSKKKLRATQVFFTPKQGGCLLFTFFFSSKTKGSTIISGDSAKHTLCHPSKRSGSFLGFVFIFQAGGCVAESALFCCLIKIAEVENAARVGKNAELMCIPAEKQQ